MVDGCRHVQHSESVGGHFPRYSVEGYGEFRDFFLAVGPIIRNVAFDLIDEVVVRRGHVVVSFL